MFELPGRYAYNSVTMFKIYPLKPTNPFIRLIDLSTAKMQL